MIENKCRHDDDDADEVPPRAERLRRRDRRTQCVDDEGIWGGGRERRGARVPHRPHAHRGVGARDQQWEVDLDAALAHLDCDLAGQQTADDERQPPREHRRRTRDERDPRVRLIRRAGKPPHRHEGSAHRRGVRQGVPQQQDEAHLRREGEQVRQPGAPAGEHVDRRRRRHRECHDGDDDCECDREDEWSGHPSFDEATEGRGDRPQRQASTCALSRFGSSGRLLTHRSFVLFAHDGSSLNPDLTSSRSTGIAGIALDRWGSLRTVYAGFVAGTTAPAGIRTRSSPPSPSPARPSLAAMRAASRSPRWVMCSTIAARDNPSHRAA